MAEERRANEREVSDNARVDKRAALIVKEINGFIKRISAGYWDNRKDPGKAGSHRIPPITVSSYKDMDECEKRKLELNVQL